MKFVDVPAALPGCCFQCRAGSSNREFFVDFEFNMDGFGAIYICNECLAEMAHTAGYLIPVEVDRLKKENEELKSEKFALEVRIQGLEQGLEGLRAAGYLGNSSVSDSVPDSNSNPVMDSEPSVEVLSEPTEVVATGTSGITEPLHDERVAEFSNAPDDTTDGGFKLGL